MTSNSMKLKAKINFYAKQNHISAQVVLQNYMFERLLERLSVSMFKKNFIIKGGVLIASIVGLNIRTTMDVDATLSNMSMDMEGIVSALQSVCLIDVQDEITFTIRNCHPIRKDDLYGGFRIRLDARFEYMEVPLSIDVSTGDIITPRAIEYEFSGIFEDNIKFKLWCYNLETILAEKFETILARGAYNTRLKDFYDIYILGTTQRINYDELKRAVIATANHRSSIDTIKNREFIIETLSMNIELQNMWVLYQKKFSYAKDILYSEIIVVLRNLSDYLN